MNATGTLEYDAELRCARSLKPWNDGPGTIGLPSATIAIVGLVVTISMTAMMVHLYSTYSLGENVSLLRNIRYQVPGLAMAAIFCVHANYRSRLSFSLRVAAWLPLIHVCLLVAGMCFYFRLLRGDPTLTSNFTLLDVIGLGWSAVAICGVFLVALVIHGVRSEGLRQPRFLYPLAICCLTFTLLLGLWLPIATDHWIPLDLPQWRGDGLAFREEFLWIALLPPIAATLLLTAVLTQARAQQIFASNALKIVAASALIVLLVISVEARRTTNMPGIIAYANLLPVLLSAALFSLVAMIAIAISHWLALRANRQTASSGPETQQGEVVPLSGSEDPGSLHNLGWFLGLRYQCDPFILRTTKGDIPIPGGARIIARLPLWTTRSRNGDSSPILRAGDRVQVVGFVAPQSDNVFRQSELPVPGSRGLVLVKLDEEATSVRRELALILWRPAVLYLAIISVVALPGLAGFLAL